MKRLRIAVIVLAALACTFVVGSNLFPDQTYASFLAVRDWIGILSAPSTYFPSAEVPPAPKVTISMLSARPRSVLLHEGAIREMSELCSRRGPKVEGSWNATAADISSLEANLSRISSLQTLGAIKGVRITRPELCYRQYIPVIVAGRKLIYVNAFCGIDPPEWPTTFVNICDGGDSVWGVLYDPATGEFSELRTNGLA